jgi:hypothetical protein
MEKMNKLFQKTYTAIQKFGVSCLWLIKLYDRLFYQIDYLRLIDYVIEFNHATINSLWRSSLEWGENTKQNNKGETKQFWKVTYT